MCANWTQATQARFRTCSTFAHTTVQCFGGMSNINFSLPPMEDTEELILCGWPDTNFDAPLVLQHFPNIQILRIQHSANLTYIDNDFPELDHLESINISETRLGYTRPTLFSNLRALRTVDLRGNQLDHMEGPLLVRPKFESLYLGGGNPWNCTRNLKWLLNETRAFAVADRDQMRCADWKYRDRPVLTIMHYKLRLREACTTHAELRNCSCTISFVRLMEDGRSLQPLYAINCSRLHLDRLPAFVPENTTIFHATDNRITDIGPLRTTYRNVQDVYLDYNHISNLDVLEGDYWLNNFRVFSLKGNKLTSIQVYHMHNALERNHQAIQLFLSQNPWRCECIFTQRFQELLMRFRTVIRDAANVTCKYIEGDANFGAQVMRLRRGDFCKLPNEHMVKPLDVLNVVLGTLIVLVSGKLGYDYYHYRKSGRLPWIVTKIP